MEKHSPGMIVCTFSIGFPCQRTDVNLRLKHDIDFLTSHFLTFSLSSSPHHPITPSPITHHFQGQKKVTKKPSAIDNPLSPLSHRPTSLGPGSFRFAPIAGCLRALLRFFSWRTENVLQTVLMEKHSPGMIVCTFSIGFPCQRTDVNLRLKHDVDFLTSHFLTFSLSS